MKNKIAPLALLVITALIAAFFIIHYCHIFYDFGLFAKERIVKNPLIAFFVTPLFFWVSAYSCRRFAINASGSNLQHIKSSLIQLKKTPNSYEKISSFVSLRVTVVGFFSSLIATFGGGSLGREGPSVHMAAGIFAEFANYFRKFFPKISLEGWIIAGCGVGLSVAFNSPIAGIIYIAEKLINSDRKTFFSHIFFTFIAILAASLILYGSSPVFTAEVVNFSYNAQLIRLIFLAFFCGISAFLFLEITRILYKKISEIKSAAWHLAPILCGFAVSVVSLYGGVYSVGGGIKTVNDALENAGILLSAGEVFGRIISTTLTFISGCAGGLVAPAIAIGAGFGSIFSHFFATLDAKIFILSGMTAFLSPVLGMPFTAAVIILQSTNQSLFSLPFLLLVSFAAFLAKPLFTRKDA